jgi:alpha-galactosidase
MDLSIAPIFPYQYAHARRVSCDAQGGIGNTSYEMNSESYGWWMAGRIYNWNDPDMIHVENPYAGQTAYTSYENKSRVTSTAVAGYMLSGDNAIDSVAPPLMQTWLTNKAINTFPAMNLKFRPVEGNTGTSPVNVMIAQGTTPNTYYIAVFNYTTSAVTEAVDLARAGLSGTTQYKVTDLWTGATSTSTGTLSISLQAAESTIVEVTQ